MDPITIIAIIVGLIVAAIFSFIDDAFEKLLNPIFRLFGLQSSTGPIDITVVKKDKFIALTLANNGRGKAKMVAIQVTDEKGKKIFPIPYLHESEVGEQTGEKKAKEFRKQLLSLKIEQGTEKTIFLNPTELEGCDLNTLETIDMNGGIWQVGSAKIG